MIVMPMHGDATMSMTWPAMRMLGMPWAYAAASFVAMWTTMMAVMMLPSLTPAMRRYHRALGEMRLAHAGPLTALFAIGYIGVWAAIGVVVFAISGGLAWAAIREPALFHAQALIAGVVVVSAGAVQLTRWKAHHLARCREAFAFSSPRHAAMAWQDGLRFGVHCALSCAGPTATLLAIGIMDLRAMAVITAAVTGERLMPGGARVARGTGALALGVGLILIARAVGVA